MKKLKHLVIAISVAIVAGINVYIANNVYEEKKSYSLLNLENIANAGELWDNFKEWWNRKDYYCKPMPCYTPYGSWYGSQLCRDPNKGLYAHPIMCLC